MAQISLASRIRGSLYGLAITDALGGPAEFHRRGTFPPVTSFRYNDNFDLPPGTWTDDTSMTLCLAQSLVENKGVFVAQDQVKRYIRWSEEGYMSATGECFDIGMATRMALRIWKDCIGENNGMGQSGSQALVEGQKLIDRSLKHEIQCGNGSLMRVAPIALIYYANPNLALQNAELSSQLTHPHPTNSEACKIYTQLLAIILKDDAPKSALAAALASYSFTSTPLRDAFSKYSDVASFALVHQDRISSSGYVVHTLEAALWAFFTTEGFREGALRAVNLGHDADTVGAVYGGLAGAYYGLEAVPQEWMAGLQKNEIVAEIVEGVVLLVERGGY